MDYLYHLKYIIQKPKLSEIFIIFDIDGVLLRNDGITIEFSPLIKPLFEFIENNNIKYGIATHGMNHILLGNKQYSPISKYIHKLNPYFIKHIGQNKYNYNQYKYKMLNDLINQAVIEYDIKNVIFFDDDQCNINSFIKLQSLFKNLKFIPMHIEFNNTDINEKQNYPLLRYNSFNNLTTNFTNIFYNLII